ncbi:MAG: hypothetical protein GWO24_05415, partial [Akkermansiaceae bacterium]|nr:hypothetical protein [Akkermansiaceae bacterium]
MNWLSKSILLLLVLGSCRGAAEVRFNRDVRPILSKNCFVCHGPDEKDRKARLRLDLAEGAQQGGKSGNPAIIAGEPGRSPLWQRITSSDPDELMPPPESLHVLDDEEKQTLRRWIAEGARYEGHWAWITPVKPALPEGRAENPIDRFVEARLGEEGLAFSPEADRRTLA